MSHRIAQLNAALQTEISQIIHRMIDIEPGTLITIDHVTLTSDLQRATVFIRVLPTQKQGTALALLRRARAEITEELGDRVPMRKLPRLVFTIAQDDPGPPDIDVLLDMIKREA